MGGLQVKHAVQRGIWVPTQHLLWDHGKSYSSWPVAGPSGCKLTASQQSSIKYTSPNISPYLCCCVFLLVSFLFSIFFDKLFSLQLMLCAYDLDKHQTVYNTRGRNKRIYEQICIQIYIYQSQSQSYITTDSQSASPYSCQAPIWDPRPIFLSLRIAAGPRQRSPARV
jgi:hypothetical protein